MVFAGGRAVRSAGRGRRQSRVSGGSQHESPPGAGVPTSGARRARWGRVVANRPRRATCVSARSVAVPGSRRGIAAAVELPALPQAGRSSWVRQQRTAAV